MVFYSFEMILVGVILLSAMTAGGIKIWLNQRKSSMEQLDCKDSSTNLHLNDYDKKKITK